MFASMSLTLSIIAPLKTLFRSLGCTVQDAECGYQAFGWAPVRNALETDGGHTGM